MTDAENSVLDRDELLQMTVDIVSAYVSNNAIASAQIPELISTIFNSLDDLREVETVEEEEPLKPAVPIRKSIGDDYIICLEDGKKLKMLKRHLLFFLNYAKQRSQFAKKIGLGRKAK
ncbi:MucR family transcriptional regulator [Thalassospira xiamenensis]|uniref:Transcriptional regulator, MucR family n=1 Tax=Thalassospira xiamenensis TaxID=220697 RepID=A0A285R9L2_9PROT|nr:MucR family transcriptional regulator [Thalassospira xiamenensis]SOB90780.1 transcriptional regulator, MucR family [Thalassospira xiamenensis]